MAGSRGEEWRSVLDTAPRDMSNPEYRKYLEKQQALEGSYPEMVVAPLLRGLAPAKVVPQEMTTLYRAEGVPYTGNSWSRQAYLESPAAKAAGRWYTDDVSALKWYADDVGENVVIKSIDAPLKSVERYRVSNLPKTSHKGSDAIDPRSYSRDPKVEFFLPEDLAKKGKRINK